MQTQAFVFVCVCASIRARARGCVCVCARVGVCVCVRETLLAKGIHVPFLPFFVPSFTSGFMASISHKEITRDKRSSRSLEV